MTQARTERVHIEYTLTFETPFHCGTGARFGLVDRTVIRDHDGYLYVPGSTIKGVLRENCEQLARFYETDREARKLIVSPHDGASALRDLGPRLTMITRLFGSQIQPGRLFFEDARQSEEDKDEYNGGDKNEDARQSEEDKTTYDSKMSGDKSKNKDKGRYRDLQVSISTQVRLDRPTRTAVPGALYTSEFGARAMTFEGSILGSLACFPIDPALDPFFAPATASAPPPSYSLLLLLAGLSMLERLGGNKSTGKGQCTCAVHRVALAGYTIHKERWQAWLEHLDILAYYTLAQEEQA